MFIAAIPWLPTPHPTNMPSATVSSDQLAMPINVGKNICLKSLETFTVPKSISSLPDIIVNFAVYRKNNN